jgi:hypothetical protein
MNYNCPHDQLICLGKKIMFESSWIINTPIRIINQCDKCAYIPMFPIAQYIRRQLIAKLLNS